MVFFAYCRLRGEIRSFRADRVLSFAQTGETFQRPENFSVGAFFLHKMLSDAVGAPQTVVRIRGRPQALDDLCGHWLLGQALVGRTGEEALFRLDERVVLGYLPFALLVYGRSIRVVEPVRLKERLAEVAAELADYYRSS